MGEDSNVDVKKLEKKIQQLEKKLRRSEQNRLQLQEIKEKDQILLRRLRDEVEEARQEVERSRDTLAVANDRMQRDLDAAARVQQAMLPSSSPDATPYHFAWRYRPCDELAGDSLNVFRIDDQHLGLYVLDVSGHGVPAALVSVTANHRLARQEGSTSLVAAPNASGTGHVIVSAANVALHLNQLYQMEDHGNHYFTMAYGVLDRHTNKLAFTLAGHPGPILIRPGEEARVLDQPGFPIGIVEEAEYDEQVIDFKPGDRLYFYSDGFNEEQGPDGEEFGQDRMIEALVAHSNVSLGDSLDALLAELAAWHGSDNFADDLSVLAIESIAE